MHGEGKGAGLVLQNIRGAVPLVHIEVDDEDVRRDPFAQQHEQRRPRR
jgi:hypothetical protein